MISVLTGVYPFIFTQEIKNNILTLNTNTLTLIAFLNYNLSFTWMRVIENPFTHNRVIIWCYLDAMKKSPLNEEPIRNLLKEATTDRIDDREIFMKGIDYSYYYEILDY